MPSTRGMGSKIICFCCTSESGTAGSMNAAAIFTSILFWGWLWGVWGLLLGVPIVMALKAVCERVEDLRPISEFLGYEDNKSTRERSEKVDAVDAPNAE